MGGGESFPRRCRAQKESEGKAVFHRDPAAERDGLAAYGPRAQQHAAGCAGALRADARARRALATGNGPRRHRDAKPGRAAAPGEAGARPARAWPRGVPEARLGLEGAFGRHHRQPAQAAGRVLRLEPRALHHGRGAVARRHQGVRRALPGRPDLQGQAPCQLGPEAANRDLRPRGDPGRDQGVSLVFQIPDQEPRQAQA